MKLTEHNRRTFVANGLAVAAASTFAFPAAAQDWPAKPVRIYVITTPGGLPDRVARLLGSRLQTVFNQSVAVENRPGASGNIATAVVAKSPPDGHALVVTGSNHAINQTLIPNAGFDYVKDVAPVGLLAESEMLLVAGPHFQPQNLTQIVARARQKPGSISMGISAVGTPNHIGAELLMSMARIDLGLIPYQGVAPMLPDLMAGRLDLMLASIGSVLPLIQEGKLKAIAVTGRSRSTLAPNIPTSAESGLPGFEVSAWISLMTTGGTPAPTVARIHGEVEKIMNEPEVRNALSSAGVVSRTSTPEQLAVILTQETEKWGGVLKNAKMKP